MEQIVHQPWFFYLRTNALSQIQGLLRNQLCGEAVALLRAAR